MGESLSLKQLVVMVTRPLEALWLLLLLLLLLEVGRSELGSLPLERLWCLSWWDMRCRLLGKKSAGSSLPRFCSHTHQRQGRCQWGLHCHVSVQIHDITATFLFRYTPKTGKMSVGSSLPHFCSDIHQRPVIAKTRLFLKNKQDWQQT